MEQKFIEFSGRTTEEAIEEGLKELGITADQADIRVIEEAKKKLFGYSKARVEIAPKASKIAADDENVESRIGLQDTEKNAAETQLDDEEKAEKRAEIHRDEQGRTDGQRAVEFLEGLFEILKITACTELKKEGEKIEIEVTASNTNSVIGKRGVMLDALQTIAGAVANTGREEYKRVVVDCENYREARETTLENLAVKLAEKAVKYEKKIKLEPMNPYERRIIHAALSNNTEVTTESEGKDPHRYIVIVPKNVRYPDRPASPAREDRPRRNQGGRRQFNRDYNRDNYNRDGAREQNGDGYRKPYNRDGYRKPYNRDGYNRDNYNRDGARENRDNYNRDGYRKPYNRDGYNRDNYNRENRDNYNRERRNETEGGTNLGERRDYNRPRTSGNTGYKKTSSDFFGTYLGNSKDNKDE